MRVYAYSPQTPQLDNPKQNIQGAGFSKRMKNGVS